MRQTSKLRTVLVQGYHSRQSQRAPARGGGRRPAAVRVWVRGAAARPGAEGRGVVKDVRCDAADDVPRGRLEAEQRRHLGLLLRAETRWRRRGIHLSCVLHVICGAGRLGGGHGKAGVKQADRRNVYVRRASCTAVEQQQQEARVLPPRVRQEVEGAAIGRAVAGFMYRGGRRFPTLILSPR